MEIIYPHPVYKNYGACTDGVVYNIQACRILKGWISNGYKRHELTINFKRVSCSAHVFIWESFHKIIKPEGHDIDHVDSNTLNNHITNLTCLSKKDHVEKTLITNQDMRKKMGRTLCRKITQIFPNGDHILFNSITDAKQANPGARMDLICGVLKGRQKTHLKCRWEYHLDDNIPGEIWSSPVNELYRGIEVSNKGRVKCKRGNITYGTASSSYMTIKINNRKYYVHIIIGEVFHGVRPTPEHTIDHINQNPRDNCSDNLRWATRIEQATNTSTARPIIGTHIETNITKKYPTIAAAARELNIYRGLISQVCRKKQHKTKGYFFEYITDHTK